MKLRREAKRPAQYSQELMNQRNVVKRTYKKQGLSIGSHTQLRNRREVEPTSEKAVGFYEDTRTQKAPQRDKPDQIGRIMRPSYRIGPREGRPAWNGNNSDNLVTKTNKWDGEYFKRGDEHLREVEETKLTLKEKLICFLRSKV